MNRTLVAVLAMIFAFIGYPLKAAERPNVIIIYTDDHGYADLSCQGIVKDIKTPHTDKLAREGVRLNGSGRQGVNDVFFLPLNYPLQIVASGRDHAGR